MKKEYVFYQVHCDDNVATALEEVPKGINASLRGECRAEVVRANEIIAKGHKVAILPIEAGTSIIKYGVVIGKADQEIPVGAWVHLHNISSYFDERSSTLDPVTGAPQDMDYT